jgi:2-keto-4-pentenoate hydratase/2-oxohepta-3-ene-1,7-dioic acid hydratase in catechol pathway
MKYCRFNLNGKTHVGLVESVAGREEITRIFLSAPEDAQGGLEDSPTRRVDAIPLVQATLLAPVLPSKIICVGRNYRDHAAELNNEVPTEPLIFFKPPSSLLAPNGTIIRPKISQRVDYEGELGVVIGKQCHALGYGEDVRPFILGFTCVNDVTARDLQKKDGQWTRAKGFDTFCPVGPVVSTEVDPWAGVSIETRINGEVRQSGNTRDFIFALDVVIRYIAEIMTLMPGDLISTGTPAGVGAMSDGDSVEISVEGIGTLTNVVST